MNPDEAWIFSFLFCLMTGIYYKEARLQLTGGTNQVVDGVQQHMTSTSVSSPCRYRRRNADFKSSSVCLPFIVITRKLVGWSPLHKCVKREAYYQHSNLSSSSFLLFQNLSILQVARKIESGTIFINSAAYFAPELPFGGVKDSGFGKELGSMGVEEFVNKKAIGIA